MKNEDLVKLEGAAKCLVREVLEECRFFVEYSEGRPASRKRLIGKIDAALSAPCPAAPDPSPEAWAELVGWAYSKDNGAKYIQEITAHYNAMLHERNRLRAELAEAKLMLEAIDGEVNPQDWEAFHKRANWLRKHPQGTEALDGDDDSRKLEGK